MVTAGEEKLFLESRDIMIELKKIDRIEDLAQVITIYQRAFADLLDKYQDIETNPATETVEDIIKKYERESNDFYFILSDSKTIGTIRVLAKKILDE